MGTTTINYLRVKFKILVEGMIFDWLSAQALYWASEGGLKLFNKN